MNSVSAVCDIARRPDGTEKLNIKRLKSVCVSQSRRTRSKGYTRVTAHYIQQIQQPPSLTLKSLAVEQLARELAARCAAPH